MANQNEASIKCTIPIDGHVRKKKGRYPYYIYTNRFGPMFLNTDDGQALIIAHMQEMGITEPEIVAAENHASEPKQEPEKPKAKHWTEGLL